MVQSKAVYMTRITIMALGSRGDVQPYVALGRALAEVGYQVRVATFESFAGLVRGQGLEFHRVEGDAEALVQLAAGSGMNTRNPIKLMGALRRSYGQMAEAYERAFLAENLRATDLILNQLPGAAYGRDLAEKLRIPHIAVSVIPLLPTRAFPIPLLAARSLGGWLNRASYTLAETLFWVLFRQPINRFRRKLGLSSAPLIFKPTSDPIINGFSERVVPRPPDWGADVHLTGWWLLDESDWTPPAALTDWLAAGDPPVFIGFGSMIAPDPAALTRTVIAALGKAGRRGVLASGWAKLGGDLPDTILSVDYVPYTWLFPRMAAMIHHGGSGTTGLALRSGVPSMVVPFAADQPYWGERTRALGVGVAPIRMQALTVDHLAAAITELTTDTGIKARAAALGAALRQEDGLGAALGIIKGILPP